jgi:hypothetical protein
MRVISPWGSDGYSITNTNGYGSCGGYQYGNFTDFTINVTAPTGVNDFSNAGSVMSFFVNISAHTLTVKLNDLKTIGATLHLTDITGRLIEARTIQSEKELFDMNALHSGIYFLNFSDGSRKQTVKVIY